MVMHCQHQGIGNKAVDKLTSLSDIAVKTAANIDKTSIERLASPDARAFPRLQGPCVSHPAATETVVHKLQHSKAQSISRAHSYLDAHADMVGIVNRTPARRQLDAVVDGLEAAATRQGALTRAMRGQGKLKRKLERDLLEVHVVPMSRLARAMLKQEPGLKALTPKLKNVGGQRLAHLARAMAGAGVPYRDLFTAAGYPAAFLEEAAAAANELDACIMRRQNLVVDRRGATVLVAEMVASGRSAIAMLDPVVGRLIAGDDALVRGWNWAKRVTASPGPARGFMTAMAAKKDAGLLTRRVRGRGARKAQPNAARQARRKR